MNNSKEQCPVCGANPTATYNLEYHKLLYHFCSEQCRENFQAHPNLYGGKRTTENDEVIKHRTLRLARPLDSSDAEALSAQLNAITGAREVQVQKSRLAIRYNLLQLTLTQIERSLDKQGFPLDNGWWQRLRLSWMRNTEQTELDNLATPAGACCNRPPPRG
jgi:YHS domain-containing protein